VDWFNLLGSKDRDSLISSIIKVIIETEGVTKLNTLDVFFDRKLRKTILIYNINSQYTKNIEAVQEVLV